MGSHLAEAIKLLSNGTQSQAGSHHHVQPLSLTGSSGHFLPWLAQNEHSRVSCMVPHAISSVLAPAESYSFLHQGLLRSQGQEWVVRMDVESKGQFLELIWTNNCFQSVLSGPAAASPACMLEMQTFGPPPRPTDSGTVGVQPATTR